MHWYLKLDKTPGRVLVFLTASVGSGRGRPFLGEERISGTRAAAIFALEFFLH